MRHRVHTDVPRRRRSPRERRSHSTAPGPLRRLRPKTARRVATLAMAVMGLGLLLLLSGAKVARQEPGWVGVVRNGGPLDDRDIRQILMPGQRVTWIGWFSQDPHNYPARHVTRLLRVEGPPDPKTNEPTPLSVPTRDGVQIGIRGAIYFNFVGQERPDLLKRFDLTIGTRKFKTDDGKELYPWEGDAGYLAMVKAIFGPVLANNLRREVGSYQCWQLVASCALVRRTPGPIKIADPGDNIQAIQERIKSSLESDVRRTFSVPYFVNIRFRISEVTLPETVQAAVDHAQAQFAGISGARAQLRQAHYQSERNRLLGEAYQRSPELARIDAIKAAPKGATVIVGGGGGGGSGKDGGSPGVLVGN